MRRTTLLTTMAMGAVITLAGNGILAASSDRATTGTNDAATGALAGGAELKISDDGCATELDDLTTGLYSAGDLVPGDTVRGQPELLCVHNVGSRDILLTLSVIDLVDLDSDCTGDEALGDSTCGGGDIGELSPQLRLDVAVFNNCALEEVPAASVNTSIADLAAAPTTLVTMAPGGAICVFFDDLLYSPSATDGEAAQSDAATWRFAFDASIVDPPTRG